MSQYDGTMDDIERFLDGDGRAMLVLTIKAPEGKAMDDEAIGQFARMVDLILAEHRARSGTPVLAEATRFPDERTAQVILRRYDVATWNDLIQIN